MGAVRDQELSGAWAARLPRAAARHTAAIRLVPGVEVCEEAESLWLRGPNLAPDLERQLRGIPGATRYRVSVSGECTVLGNRVPSGSIPAEAWRPLADWLSVEVASPALPGVVTERVALRLRRTDVDRSPDVLVTALEAWASFALGASSIRLRRLSFAADDRGRVIVRGSPLPPIPGTRYVESEGVALPCGFEFEPAVEPGVVGRMLWLAGDLALFHEDGSYERLLQENFATASRSAVRLTLGDNRGH